EKITRLAPGILFRSIGMGAICQAWGGFLAETPLHTGGGDPKDMGALIITLRIDLFTDPAQFKSEMDTYVQQVRALTPPEGFSQTYLPGGSEAAQERENREKGIPAGEDYCQQMEKLASELNINVPW
ncbi:MAG: Ldh family oxidoreductase, partial [Candidatus Latescibacteria bacterium]|nr:Ldh family oxidoreductase [Candidatus Latescibacterota bacterium]